MALNGYLMSGNIPAARIDNGHVKMLEKQLLPVYISRGGDPEAWLISRAIDSHRPNSRVLKKVLRLKDVSDLAAVLHVHGASVTDNYWFRQDGEEQLGWDDVRFSSDTFSEIALTGSFESYNRQYDEKDFCSGSPELTNIGSFEKCWKLEDGKWWMYKSGSPLERFSELFTAALGNGLGFSMAQYLPAGRFIKTPDFTKGLYNFEPASALSGENEDYTLNYDLLVSICPDFGKQFLDILYMDALVLNMDRHTANFGFLRKRTDGTPVCMAPNFDNNIALISRGYGKDPCNTSPLLIGLFHELLSNRNLRYNPPVISENKLRDLAEDTLPEENINRDYVVSMVLSRQEQLCR